MKLSGYYVLLVAAAAVPETGGATLGASLGKGPMTIMAQQFPPGNSGNAPGQNKQENKPHPHDKESTKKGGGTRAMEVSPTVPLEWNLYWFHEDDTSSSPLECAWDDYDGYYDGYIIGKNCVEDNPYNMWGIFPLGTPDYGFQIFNQGSGKCVGVGDCGDEQPLIMTSCSYYYDTPNKKAVWYVGNIGTFNSYYCWVSDQGLYYIDPTKSGPFELEDDPVEADEGMFFFHTAIPDKYFNDLAYIM